MLENLNYPILRIPSKDKQELINIIKRGNWSE